MNRQNPSRALTLILAICALLAIQGCHKDNSSTSNTTTSNTAYVNSMTFSSCNVTHAAIYFQYSFTNMVLGQSYAITSVAWDFGDGTTSSAITNAVHMYTAPGTYTVTVVVNDDQAHKVSQQINITDNPIKSPYTSQMNGQRNWSGSYAGSVFEFPNTFNTTGTPIDAPFTMTALDSGVILLPFQPTKTLNLTLIDTTNHFLEFTECGKSQFQLYYYYLKDSMAYQDEWSLDHGWGYLTMHTY